MFSWQERILYMVVRLSVSMVVRPGTDGTGGLLTMLVMNDGDDDDNVSESFPTSEKELGSRQLLLFWQLNSYLAVMQQQHGEKAKTQLGSKTSPTSPVESTGPPKLSPKRLKRSKPAPAATGEAKASKEAPKPEPWLDWLDWIEAKDSKEPPKPEPCGEDLWDPRRVRIPPEVPESLSSSEDEAPQEQDLGPDAEWRQVGDAKLLFVRCPSCENWVLNDPGGVGCPKCGD